MELDINGRVALVTGASKGIGLAIARRLAREGARIALVARNEITLDEAAASLQGPCAADALTICCDVTDASQIETSVAKVKATLGPVDILVNNAGGLSTGALDPLEALSDEAFRATFDLNLLSAVRFTRAVVAGMTERRWGRIVCISSESGAQPDPIGADYNAAKAALNAFAKTISKAYGEQGVRVNTVSPAFTLTEGVKGMIAAVAEQSGASLEEAGVILRKSFRPNIAVGRGGEPEEIADAVAFLVSDRAAFINGVVLRVDGGSISTVGG